MQGHRLRYGFALGCLVVATLLNYGVPLIGSVTIDFAISNKPVAAETPGPIRWLLELLGGSDHLSGNLWLAPVVMVLLSAIGGVFSYLKGWQASLASDGIARRLKDNLYDHLNQLPARYHDQSDTGDLVQRCTSDVETTRLFLATQIMDIGNALILAGTALPLLLSIHVPMTLVSFALIGPIIIYGYVYFRKVRHVFKQVEQAESELTGIVQENLTGIRVVRAFSQHEHERKKFASPNANYRDRSLRMIRLLAWYWSISDFVALSQLGLTLLVGAHWVATGQITVGMLFAFLSFLTIMLWPVRQMGRILTDLGKTTVALGRIHEILGVAPEPDPEPAPNDAASPPPLTGQITVSDLHFNHDTTDLPAEGRGALNGISFTVNPGETVAILGPSGSGKSTLMHLLLRLYDYGQGSIKFDGHELSTLPRKWVRGQIGVVMQEPFLFSKSLRDNLRLGQGDAADHEVEFAARMASIHETILSFEEGYETVIGERGVTLSGGQRQRVAIARAVLRQAPLLILDDAMSAIDAETETVILDALKTRRGQTTTLVIAHRLATLVHADRIIVLDHGSIIQTGTHDELAAQDGLYRRLWQIQTNVETEFRNDLETP
ncbi:MAG: ABC transporter ATP-binding protein [Opitutaceae bacterium]|jgi:ATP-binding cassette, subfamily B, bacterial|nr:ABC transporter ATP-binding protein [Opitutaceae bacterium]